MNLNVIEWNLNFGSYNKAKPAEFIEDFIAEYDVGVLTEVRINDELIGLINKLGYDYIVSEDQGEYSNQIIIFAAPKYRLKKYEIQKNAGITGQDNGVIPDFLHGTIQVGDKQGNIVGIRVKIRSKYEERYCQVKWMKSYLELEIESKIKGFVVCAGDFNSGQIRGEDTEHSDVQDLYQYKTGTKEPSELRFYNFHKIRDLLGKKYVLKEIEGEENSWGLMEKNDKIEFGYGCVKNDLIFWSIDIKGEAEEEFFF